MTGLDDVIARLEQATAEDQFSVLHRAFYALSPEPLLSAPDWVSWKEKHSAFIKMLDAEAYESAALTLLPDYCNLSLNIAPFPTHVARLNCPAGSFTAVAPTPAIALCIAALRATPPSPYASPPFAQPRHKIPNEPAVNLAHNQKEIP